MATPPNAPPHAPKPIASLTPTLLARKGGARPAMRAQSTFAGPDDLGWNDMGDDLPTTAEIVPILRDGAAPRRNPSTRRAAAKDVNRPGRKSAFTLRLDAERHLKLRLACTLDERSAQALVTDALDRLLAEMPDVTALIDRVGKQRRS